MKNLQAEFIFGAVAMESFPRFKYPEIAFIGRSNVGKSSLLNSIVLRKNLARISSTPGKTQQINLFLVDNKYVFADLPGFGYASVAKTEREKWRTLNMAYLKDRENLSLVCMLVDSRHDPMDKDIELMEFLENAGRKFIVILTKCDKISPRLATERKKQIENLLQFCNNALEVLPYSAINNQGRDQLLAIIKKSV